MNPFHTIDRVTRRGTHKRGFELDLRKTPFYDAEPTASSSLLASNAYFRASFTKLVLAFFWAVIEDAADLEPVYYDAEEDGLSVRVFELHVNPDTRELGEIFALAINAAATQLGLDLDWESFRQSGG